MTMARGVAECWCDVERTIDGREVPRLVASPRYAQPTPNRDGANYSTTRKTPVLRGLFVFGAGDMQVRVQAKGKNGRAEREGRRGPLLRRVLTISAAKI
jgi:hypothetical protein